MTTHNVHGGVSADWSPLDSQSLPTRLNSKSKQIFHFHEWLFTLSFLVNQLLIDDSSASNKWSGKWIRRWREKCTEKILFCPKTLQKSYFPIPKEGLEFRNFMEFPRKLWKTKLSSNCSNQTSFTAKKLAANWNVIASSIYNFILRILLSSHLFDLSKFEVFCVFAVLAKAISFGKKNSEKYRDISVDWSRFGIETKAHR